MRTMKQSLLVILMSITSLTVQASDIVAFPGASGWGRWSKGARASSSPVVYHVTNLNDSGTGSLRDAISSGNRIVVFDVSGVIKISSRLVFNGNSYIAGQTAPGEGITVYGDGVSFSGAGNIICRYMRFRMGHNGTSGKDCAGVANGYNMIFDHCSFSWGLDETFSINAFGKAGNITLSNCIIGQGLMTHSAGGLMQADSITLYRNLYIDNSTRNNKVKGINQYGNNIVYNWNNGCYIMGGDSEGSSYCNIQSNLFINGPSGGGNALGGGNSDFHFYGADNWQDSNKDGIFSPSCIDDTQTGGGDKVSTPYNYPDLELYPGNELIEKNIPTVGASLPYRDQSDCYMIDELMSYGESGALISNEETLAIGAPSTWTWFSGTKKTDTDGDGMPDAWETANGLNPNSAADAVMKASNGYLNIENYINGITVDDRDYFLRAPITLSMSKATTSTMTLSWRDYTYAEEGFEVSYAVDGSSTYTVAGKAAAGATSYTITGLKDATYYIFRVRAFGTDAGSTKYSDYATGRFSTKPIESDIVDIDSYDPDVTNSTTVADGQKLLLTTDVTLSYTLPSAISPASVVAKGKGTITVSGAAITGTGSMNKSGEGTLVLNNTNSYTGATVLHEGTIQFSSIANGGTASAIGASQNYAQNWIFDGGTYEYTGGTASTDRCAQIKSESTLKVGSSGKTLTMNGAFEGSGNLILDGPGQVTVGTSNFFSYTGTTKIKGGTLYLSTTDIASAGIGKSSKLILAGGKLSTNGDDKNYETYSFPIEVEENTTSIFVPHRNCYMKSTITGAGTFEYDIPYLREYFDPNITGFTGQIIANGIGTDSWGSLFLSQGSFNMPTTRVYLKGNAKMCMWTTNGDGYIGGLSGDAGTYLMASSKNTDGTKCNWTIGGSNSDETFRGIINNSCCASGHTAGTNNITKVGTGLWRLTANNTYSGTTTVNGGKLIVNGKPTGTGAYIVNDGGTLAGEGTIAANITVNSGGTIYAGDTIVKSKFLYLSGTTTINKGGTVSVPLFYDGKKYTNIFSFGTLSLNNGAILNIDMEVTKSLPTGTQVQCFYAKGITGTFSGITPETPGDKQIWDTSHLYTDGYLIVKDAATTINTINTSSTKDSVINVINTVKLMKNGKLIIIKNGGEYTISGIRVN